MSRLILLDSGPLGLVTNPSGSDRSRACNNWLFNILAGGSIVMVPEIADYEVRRELTRAGRHQGLARLDELADRIGYLPITTAVWRRAAEFWARSRTAGKPTAPDAALDGDMLLAAQAAIASEDDFQVVVATTNVGHLGRFVDARPWHAIVDLEISD